MKLNPARLPAWSRIVICALAVVLASALRLWLLAELGTRAPFLTFYPAVILASLIGGLSGGLLATVLSAFIAAYVWIEPVGQLAIRDKADWLGLGVFTFSGAVISVVTQMMQRAQVRAREAESQVQFAKERSQAQEVLRRYQLLAEHSRDIILYMQRGDGRLLEANAAAVHTYGYTREELLSLSIHDLRAAEHHALTAGQLAQADTAGILFETLHRRKDGTTFPVEVSSQGATIGGTRTLISVVRDITQRREAEEKLREHREWLRVTLTSIGDAVLATGADETITFLNPVACQLTGWPESEALGQPVRSVFRIINERSRIPSEDFTGRVLREGVVVSLSNDTALLHRDGREIPIEDSAAPIRGADGQVAGVVIVFHEVIEKRRSQQALQAERERLRLALDASNSGIWEWDLQTNANYWSDELWKIYGLEPYSCEPSYQSWVDVVIPEDRAIAEEAAQTAVRNNSELNTEFRVRNPDGSTRWLMARGRPQHDASGRAIKYTGIAVDITVRKREEEALRESESRLRTLGDSLPEGAIYRYCHDADGTPHVDFISAGIELLTGFPADRFMSDAGTMEVSIVPEDRILYRSAVAHSAQTLTRFEVEVRHQHPKTGQIRWSLLRAMPTRGQDGSTIWDGIALDITDRKRVEEALHASEQALRESEARYRRLVDLAPEAMVVQQADRVMYCNQATAALYGAPSPEALLGTSMLDRVHPDELPAVKGRIRAAEGGAQLPVRETRHVRFDGSVVAVETCGGRVEWHGSPALLVFVRDITERKRNEALLRDAQKFESLGILAGGVAHDFNNLLVGVIGNASLGRRSLAPDHPVAKLLDDVVKAGQQAAHLTRQMLAYSGKGRFVVEPLNLSAILPEFSGLVRPSISKKITLQLNLEPNLPSIEADRGQIQQVFMNLALNAAEAIGSHEGSITVSTSIRDVDDAYIQRHATSTPLTPGRYVSLEVRDTGCGMDEITQARIFDPFFSTKFVGRGLGLAAVAGIVRGHKGAISVSSAPQQGSCFTILFPSAVTATPAPAIFTPKAPELQGSGTVLVVDDEPMVRTLLQKTLELLGYTVLEADGGLAAIEMLRRHPNDIALVILDLSMPHMSGEETLPQLRKVRPGIKVLLSSGYSEAESMRSFQGQSVTGFIQKPYTLSVLAEKLKDCLK